MLNWIYIKNQQLRFFKIWKRILKMKKEEGQNPSQRSLLYLGTKNQYATAQAGRRFQGETISQETCRSLDRDEVSDQESSPFDCSH